METFFLKTAEWSPPGSMVCIEPILLTESTEERGEGGGGGGVSRFFLLPGLTLCDLSDPGGISQTCSLLIKGEVRDLATNGTAEIKIVFKQVALPPLSIFLLEACSLQER